MTIDVPSSGLLVEYPVIWPVTGGLVGILVMFIARGADRGVRALLHDLLYVGVSIASGLLLGRAYHVIFLEGRMPNLNDLSASWDLSQGGWSILGVIAGFGLAAALAVVTRMYKDASDPLARASFGILTAQVVGRLGCLFNGCCYGRPTVQGFGVVYPPNSIPGLRYGPAPVHPVQLYESLLNLLLIFALLAFWRRGKHRGWWIVCAYLGGYGINRLGTQLLRGDFEAEFLGLSWPGVHAACLVLAGAVGCVFLKAVRYRRDP